MERPGYHSHQERDYMARGWWRDDDTLWQWLDRHAGSRPEHPAVVSAAGVITWRALHDRVLKVANGLRKKGIDASDVVALQLPNIPEFLIAHLAIARLGAVMCTVHMPYRGAEIESILTHSGAKLFFNTAYRLAEGGAARLSHHARQQPHGRARASPQRAVARPVPRAVFASLRPVFAALRLVGGRLHRAAPGLQARRARPDGRARATHRALDRAGACRRVPQRRAFRPARLVLARARDRLGLDGAAGAGALFRRAAAGLRRDPALGHDRAAGRALHPAGRRHRGRRDERRAAEPRHASAHLRGGRAAGARAAHLL